MLQFLVVLTYFLATEDVRMLEICYPAQNTHIRLDKYLKARLTTRVTCIYAHLPAGLSASHTPE